MDSIINERHVSVNFDAMRRHIEEERTRSAWDRGVMAYALELLEQLEDGVMEHYIDVDNLLTPQGFRGALLNGASNWS